MNKKIAIITGASSGMGRQFAVTAANHGSYDEMWVIARNREKLEKLAELTDIPVKVLALDLTDPESAAYYGELLKQEHPAISLMINAGGFGRFESCENLSLEDGMGMIELNCRALTELTLLSLPYMEKGSELINIASVAAFVPVPYMSIYAATKAYVLSFTKALNAELKGKGIKVLALCPYWTKTAFMERANSGNGSSIKKYSVLYDTEFIVNTAWRAIEKGKRSYVIPGIKARLEVFGMKCLPNGLIMKIWIKQQGIEQL